MPRGLTALLTVALCLAVDDDETSLLDGAKPKIVTIDSANLQPITVKQQTAPSLVFSPAVPSASRLAPAIVDAAAAAAAAAIGPNPDDATSTHANGSAITRYEFHSEACASKASCLLMPHTDAAAALPCVACLRRQGPAARRQGVSHALQRQDHAWAAEV